MGEKFLRTARSRFLFVFGLGAILILAVIVAMCVSAFTAESWWAKPKDGWNAGFIWTSISQAIIFILLAIGGIVLVIGAIAFIVTFLFDKKYTPIFRTDAPPFRTLRDFSPKYDAVIMKLKAGLVKFGKVIRSPFRALWRTIDNWIDRGE